MCALGSVTWGSAVAERLERLHDVLLVQCTAKEANDALELAARPGGGVVVTAPRDRRDVRAFAGIAQRLETPLLVDASAYSGSSRRRATARFDPAWLQVQRDSGLPVLSDSGYIGEGDIASLQSVLGQARAAGDVIATLPLHAGWWFDPRQGLPRLLDGVRDANVPIAVVLEHRDDPFGVARTLNGVLALLQVGVPALQLRCDVSGLGLLCHGALAAAVGTRTSLRHLYPQTDSVSGGFNRGPTLATVVRDCLSFQTLDKIVQAIQADPDSSLWTECTCPSCNGRQLDRIAMVPEHLRPARAFGHALNMLFDLHDDLIGRAANPLARQQSWREHCNSAAFRFEEIRATGQPWKVPAFLHHWRAVPVPSHAA
jgi:hypothetical protein